MDQPSRSLEARPDDAEPSILPKALLAGGAGAVGGAAGGWLMSVIAGAMFYVPLIPGAVAGYAVNKACSSDRVLICTIAGFFGFAGMVFGDALTFDLTDHPGTWNYITHFWLAAKPIKVVFWILNAAVGYWFALAGPASQLR